MERHKSISGGLIGWLCFVGFVTWLDWLGLIPYFIVGFGRFAFFLIVIVLLFALGAVLRSAHMARLQRAILVLSILWLLVLPFIPWKTEKALIIGYLALVPGMPRTVVHTIMTAHPGIHDPGDSRGIYCAEREWKDSSCPWQGTYVRTYMVGDVLVSAEIELD
jgi:hypothetical protein